MIILIPWSLTRDGYYTRAIKTRIVMAKYAFNRIISLFSSMLNVELRKKWLSVTSAALHCMAQRPRN